MILPLFLHQGTVKPPEERFIGNMKLLHGHLSCDRQRIASHKELCFVKRKVS